MRQRVRQDLPRRSSKNNKSSKLLTQDQASSTRHVLSRRARSSPSVQTRIERHRNQEVDGQSGTAQLSNMLKTQEQVPPQVTKDVTRPVKDRQQEPCAQRTKIGLIVELVTSLQSSQDQKPNTCRLAKDVNLKDRSQARSTPQRPLKHWRGTPSRK